MSGIVIYLLFLCFPAYVIAQIIAVVRLRRGRLWVSLVPVLPMIYVTVVTIQAYREESNLWPLFLLMASPVALLIVLTCLRLHALERRKSLKT